MCKVHHVNTIYMTSEQLFSQIRSKRSFLCVGLDTDVNKIPRHLLSQDDPVFAFNRAIVDATAPYAVCYKPRAGRASAGRSNIFASAIPIC